MANCNLLNIKSRHNRAFTLMEVLLTIAILASAMAIIGGVLVSSLETRELIEESIVRYEAGPAILRIMAEDIRATFIPVGSPTDKEFFVGRSITSGIYNADRLDFVSTRNSFDPDTGVECDVTEIGYQMLPNYEDASLYRLMRREDPFIDDKPLSGGALAQMYDRVKSLKFEYFDGKEWKHEWNNAKQGGKLPEAVKIELILSLPQTDAADESEPYEPTFSTIVSLPR